MNERARVPFALVGVVLLVGSATLSGALGGVDPAAEPRVDTALSDAETELGGTLRDATTDAARAAAAAPVITPANTTVGRVLAAQDDPFRAAVELRVYLAFRTRLSDTRARGLRVNASLPRLETGADIRRALERVHLERRGPNGTDLRVRVDGLRLTAFDGARRVERVSVSPSVVVSTPLFRLHERTERFDRRLDADVTRPGLARRTTARLYAVAWARGAAQHGGAPIANVVANRHVALATNDALLAEQRAVFGTADDAARRGTRIAAARAAGTDLLRGAGAPAREAEAIIEAADGVTPGSTLDPLDAHRPEARMGETVRVGVNRTADEAFRRFTDGGLRSAVRDTYRVTAERRVDVTTLAVDEQGSSRPPGADWTRVGSVSTRGTSVTSTELRNTEAAGRWHVLAADARRVVEVVRTTHRWRRGNETTRTTRTVTRTYRVVVRVVGRHDGGDAPDRPISPVHEPGTGAFDGPNLAGVATVATERLVRDASVVDALARRAVTDSVQPRETTIHGERPAGLRPWLYRDLVALRAEVRNVSVTVSRGAVGTYRVNPAAKLAAELRERRASLVGVPARYDGVAGRARVAARTAYLDAVIRRLDQRAARRTSTGDRFEGVLATHGLSRGQLAETLRARETTSPPARDGVDTSRGELVVEGAPAYLTLASVPRRGTDARGTGSHRPLAARNLNLFTAPYGDIADNVVGELFSADRTQLRTAAVALRAADRLAANTTDERLDRRRAELRKGVDRTLTRRRNRFRGVLRAAGVGDSAADRHRIVDAGLSRWDSLPVRAIAVANGSAADAIADEAVRRYPDAVEGVEARDTLRLRLRAASEGPGPRESAVNGSTRAAKRVATAVTERAVQRGGRAALDRVERRVGRSLARVPTGVPVTPVPSAWYATTNVWLVEASGSYDRFAVRTRTGTPGREFTYVRNGDAVRIDWDEDGTAERVGRAAAVNLSLRTAVVVVVPPGGQGVGDTDGNADKRSPGWDERNSKALRGPPRTAGHVPRTRRRPRGMLRRGAVRGARS